LDGPTNTWFAVCMFLLKNMLVREQVGDQVRAQVWVQVREQVWDQVRAQVWDQVRAQVGDQVRDQVGAQVRAQVRDQVGAHVWEQVIDQVREQVWEQVRAQVGDQVGEQVGEQVIDQVREQVREQVWDQVGDQVRAQVWDQVRDQVGDQVWDQVREFVYPWLCGSNEASCFSFYDFMQNELGIESNLWDKFNIWKETSKLGLIYPLENICIVSEKPIKIVMVDGKLHCDGGPSVEYADGTKVWSLNGVRVPKYLAETPEGGLSTDFFNKEKNADVRAEFIRKYGIERMEKLGKSVDSYKNYSNKAWFESEYELIDMSPIFQSINYAPHLKMKNQTTGIYHLEAVHPSCKTLANAFETTRWNGRKLTDYKTEEVK